MRGDYLGCCRPGWYFCNNAFIVWNVFGVDGFVVRKENRRIGTVRVKPRLQICHMNTRVSRGNDAYLQLLPLETILVDIQPPTLFPPQAALGPGSVNGFVLSTASPHTVSINRSTSIRKTHFTSYSTVALTVHSDASPSTHSPKFTIYPCRIGHLHRQNLEPS